MEIKLPFGIRDGKLIHISDLSINERGLNCNCVCPKCGEKLIAKMGDIRKHHFSHFNDKCDYALETSIHLFAKEVLEQYKKIVLPELILKYSVNFNKLSDFDSNTYINPLELRTISIVKEQELTFDKVDIEERIDNIIPDIVLYKNNIPIIVEIAVTNFVSTRKKDKIRKLGISAIEIDLHDYNFFDKEKLKNAVIYETKCKKWIFNRKEVMHKKKIIEENKKNVRNNVEEEYTFPSFKNKKNTSNDDYKDPFDKEYICVICNKRTKNWGIRFGDGITCLCNNKECEKKICGDRKSVV